MAASIEATLDLWASSLRDVKGRIRPLFTQERVALSAGQFLDGLLGGEQRKTGWSRARAVQRCVRGMVRTDAQQAVPEMRWMATSRIPTAADV